VPATLTLPEGQTTMSFVADTIAVAANHAVVISASRGAASKTANLTVKAPAPTSLVLNPSSVTGGTIIVADLTMSGKAPVGGLEVSLSTTNSAAMLPATITVLAGENTVSIKVHTNAVAVQATGVVSATYNGVTRSDALVVKAPVVSGVSLNPAEVGGGASSVGTVALTGPAPTGGVVVQLTSSKPANTTVPAEVTIPAGESAAQFAITTTPVTTARSVVISATLGVKKTATLMVAPVALSGVSVDPTNVSVFGSAIFTITLNGPAPSGGRVVNLSSSDPAVVSLPPGITIAAGSSSTTITVTASAAGTAHLTATANGVSFTATLTAGP
jgi:hypothetical protein